MGGSFGPAAAPIGRLATADISARDLLFTSAGAADTQRLAFAAAWQAMLHGPAGQLGGHRITAQLIHFSSDKHLFQLDSLCIAPPAPGQGKPGAVRVAFSLPRLQVLGLQAAHWQHLRRFRADSARLSNPSLTFRPPAQAPPPLWKLLAPLFRQADLRQLAIANGYLAVAGVKEGPAVRHVFALGRSIRVDSAAEQDGSRRVLYARGWTGRTGRITAVFMAPLYPASIGHLFLNTEHQALRLTDLAVRPTLTPAQLNIRSGYQLTQLTAHIAELNGQGVDFYQLSDNSHLRVARVVAERPYLKLSSDGRGPINSQPSILTPEAMRKLHAHLDVRRLDLRNGTIAASYRSPRTPLIGTCTINRLNATLRNVSNDPRHMTMAQPLTGSATAYIENRCRAQVQLTTSLLDPQGRQHLWGSFGPAALAILNPIMKPTRLIEFKSGDVQRITFDEHLDRQHITGQMRATYSGLKFEFLGYKQGEVKKTLLGRVKSGVVNGLVIRDQNPRPDGRFVVGQLTSRRELQFSVFTAWRQGLLSGLLNSAGVPTKLAQKYSESSDKGPLPAH
ncbi:hypothetical protein [Hymenobacter sp. BRD67]|uniref:hypothetical protein n=1 Tax=Hymenobacter sp. BRD67 TaxID=2675877 RepID=UPI00156633C2|nr:hypothetical protein [Hymenobacter sp. BRD67]QKG52262.1 hypothetical protein GKZ67_06075 [Hymenobacter sp. BRD67]